MSWMATAVVGSAVVGGYMSSKAQKSAAKTAAGAQTEAARLAAEGEQRQFDQLREMLSPFTEAAAGSGIAGLGVQSPAQEIADLYRTYLGRDPEPAGLKNWADHYKSGMSMDEIERHISSGPEARERVLSGEYIPAEKEKGSLEAQLELIGLKGPEAQQLAISGIEGSPAFEALTRQGEEAILSHASATGGLRGGDTQAALAQFRPAVLSQLIESQYSKLGDITRIGQSAAAGVGAAGTQSASNISNLLMQSGQAQAQSALTSGAAQSQMWGDIAGAVGTGAGMYARGATF